MPSITSSKKKEEGFSLIELMVVLVIIVALTILVLAGYSETGSRLALERTVESFISDINSTKQRSMSSLSYLDLENDEVEKLGLGIYVEEGEESYIIFKDKDETKEFTGNDEIVRKAEIEKGVFVENIKVEDDNTPTSLSVLFSPESEDVYFNGESGDAEIIFKAQGGQNLTRIVQINSSGVTSVSYE